MTCWRSPYFVNIFVRGRQSTIYCPLARDHAQVTLRYNFFFYKIQIGTLYVNLIHVHSPSFEKILATFCFDTSVQNLCFWVRGLHLSSVKKIIYMYAQCLKKLIIFISINNYIPFHTHFFPKHDNLPRKHPASWKLNTALFVTASSSQ